MAELPRINWGDTNWSDVQAYVDEHPNDPTFLQQIFGPWPEPDWVKSGDSLGARISRAWRGFDNATMTADSGLNNVIGGAADAAAGAAAGVRQAGQLAPYLAIGAGALLIWAVVRAR